VTIETVIHNPPPRYAVDVYAKGVRARTLAVIAGNAFIAELKAYRQLAEGESLQASRPRLINDAS
jgi:hypothetical protein